MPRNIPEKRVDAGRFIDDSGVRSSVHSNTRYFPVDVTLATTDTPQDIYNVDTQPAAAFNLYPDSSFEAGITAFTASGATLTNPATTPRNGTDVLQIDPDNLAAGEGGYYTTEALGSGRVDKPFYLVVSAYIRDAAGSGDDARIAIRDTSGNLLAAGNTITLAAAYARTVAQFPLPPASAQYRVYIETVSQHNTNFQVDDLQIEVRTDGVATEYINTVDLPLNTFDEGAAGSYRLPPIKVITGYDFTVDLETYIALDHVASAATGLVIPASGRSATEHPIHFTERVSFMNTTGVETPRVTGVIWGRSEIG